MIVPQVLERETVTVLTTFLAGDGPDAAGRLIEEIWRQPVIWLESRHDFIQWLFPLPEPSSANPEAPVLTPAEAEAIAATPALQASLLSSLDALGRLYGIARDGASFRRGPGFPGPFTAWLGPIDHNHLRFSRILRCLCLCGLGAEAAGLRRLLGDIGGVEAAGQWSGAERYWRDAVIPPPGWPVRA